MRSHTFYALMWLLKLVKWNNCWSFYITCAFTHINFNKNGIWNVFSFHHYVSMYYTASITRDNTLYTNSQCHIRNSQLPASESISVDYSIAYLDDLSEWNIDTRKHLWTEGKWRRLVLRYWWRRRARTLHLSLTITFLCRNFTSKFTTADAHREAVKIFKPHKFLWFKINGNGELCIKYL